MGGTLRSLTQVQIKVGDEELRRLHWRTIEVKNEKKKFMTNDYKQYYSALLASFPPHQYQSSWLVQVNYRDARNCWYKMAEAPQESLRKHRQTLAPQNGGHTLKQQKSYGNLLTPEGSDLLSVAQRDKDKV